MATHLMCMHTALQSMYDYYSFILERIWNALRIGRCSIDANRKSGMYTRMFEHIQLINSIFVIVIACPLHSSYCAVTA